jgi:hypothetical protein
MNFDINYKKLYKYCRTTTRYVEYHEFSLCTKSTSQYLMILFGMLQDNELCFTVMPHGNDCKTLMQNTNWTLEARSIKHASSSGCLGFWINTHGSQKTADTLTTHACKLYSNIYYITTQIWKEISAFMYIKNMTPAPMQHLVLLKVYHGKQITLSRKAV